METSRDNYFHNAVQLFYQQNFDSAIVYFKQALSCPLNPFSHNTDALIHSNIGMCYSRLEKYKEALHYLKIAQREGNNNSETITEIKWIENHFKMKNNIKTEVVSRMVNSYRLTEIERISIYSMMGNMVNSDGKATSEELLYLEKTREIFNLSEDENLAARRLSADTIMGTIKNMDISKKTDFLLLMNEAINIDGPATDKELWFLGAITVNCQLILF